jgi:hypothetical protein
LKEGVPTPEKREPRTSSVGGGCRQGAHTHTPHVTHPPAIHSLLQDAEDRVVVARAAALVEEVIQIPVGEGIEYAGCDGRAGGEDLNRVVVVVAFPLHRWLQS